MSCQVPVDNSDKVVAHFTNSSTTQYDGVCVFDIDSTLTAPECSGSEDHPKTETEEEACKLEARNRFMNAIHACEEKNMALAINTARGGHSFWGVHPDIQEKFENAPFCHRHPDNYDPPGGKVECMNVLREAYDLSKQKLVLIDDRPENCERVTQNGYKCILVDDEKKGITKQEVERSVKMK